MQGKIEADLAAMPFENMALLFAGIAVLLVLFAVILIVLVRKLGIKSIGPISLEHHGQSSMFSMNEANKELDDTCRRQMRETTSKMKRHISNIFAELRVCTIARVAISSAIRYPMYESIANNHFTTELMPDHYAAYRERIIEAMRDEYKSLSAASMDLRCGREALPSWDDVGKQLIECVDLWLRNVSREVLSCCEKKIAVYESYLPFFEAAKDGYRAGIIKNCIEKNRQYMAILKTRAGSGAL